MTESVGENFRSTPALTFACSEHIASVENQTYWNKIAHSIDTTGVKRQAELLWIVAITIVA